MLFGLGIRFNIIFKKHVNGSKVIRQKLSKQSSVLLGSEKLYLVSVAISYHTMHVTADECGILSRKYMI